MTDAIEAEMSDLFLPICPPAIGALGAVFVWLGGFGTLLKETAEKSW